MGRTTMRRPHAAISLVMMACVAAIMCAGCSESQQVSAQSGVTSSAEPTPAIKPNPGTKRPECQGGAGSVTLGPSQTTNPYVRVESEWQQSYLTLTAKTDFYLIGAVAGSGTQQAFVNLGQPVKTGDPINLVADQFTGTPNYIDGGIATFDWLTLCTS